MEPTPDPKPENHRDSTDRRILMRYALLTVALCFPLLLAFVFTRNLYPFAASTMMMGLKDTQSGRDYYFLRGETVAGEAVDLRAIELTNALTGRSWSLVSATVENKSFKIRWPHPENTRLMAGSGDLEQLPRAARLADLLRAWGTIYNARLPATSNQRLRSLRIDKFRWEGGINGEYNRFIESWTTVL